MVDVTGVTVGLLLLQPEMPIEMAPAAISVQSKARLRRLRRKPILPIKTVKKMPTGSAANVTPPVRGASAPCSAVVCRLTVTVAGLALDGVTEDGEIVQVAPDGAPAQVSATV